MTKFKYNIGDEVTITGDSKSISKSPVGWSDEMEKYLGKTYPIEGRSDALGENYKLGGTHIWSWPVESLTLTTDVAKAKPRVRIKASGRRQFDVAFKQMVVREYNALPKVSKNKTGVKDLLTKYDIRMARLTYWRKQHSQGHFSAERAVSFSRKDTMVHG